MKKLALYLFLLVTFFVITNKVSAATILQINAGGDTQGSYAADTDYSGGSAYSSSNAVDTSGVTNPAPQAVYQTVRYGNAFTYTIPNLTANGNYTVRLHFNELYWSSAGSRVFNVSINGSQVLSNFDIYQQAGGANKALIKEFPVAADSNGNIIISFSTVTDNAVVNGIEILSEDNLTPTPTPTPTQITTSQIADGAITNPKLADGAVSGSKLLDNVISTMKLIDGAVTTAKIADNSVTLNKLDTTTISDVPQVWQDNTDDTIDASGNPTILNVPTNISVTVPAGKVYNYMVVYNGQLSYSIGERLNNNSSFYAAYSIALLSGTTTIGFQQEAIQTGYRNDWNAVGGGNYWISPFRSTWLIQLTEGVYPLTASFSGYSDTTMRIGHLTHQSLQVMRVL